MHVIPGAAIADHHGQAKRRDECGVTDEPTVLRQGNGCKLLLTEDMILYVLVQLIQGSAPQPRHGAFEAA